MIFSKKRNIWLFWYYVRSDNGKTWPQQDIGTEGKAAILSAVRGTEGGGSTLPR